MRTRSRWGLELLAGARVGRAAVSATVGLAVAGLLSVGGAAGGIPTGCGSGAASWASAGGDVCDTHYSTDPGAPSVSSVSNLVTKWTYPAHGNVTVTPAVSGGVVY